MRGFFRNAGLIAAAELVARLKGFVVIPLLTHKLGTSGYGVWAQVAVLVAVLGPLIMLGTDSGVVRYLPGADKEERTRRFVGWLLAIGTAAAVITFFVAVLRKPLAVAAFGSDPEYARYIPLAAALTFVTIATNFARTWFRLENDARGIAAITIGQAIGGAVVVVLWYSIGHGLYRLILWSIASDAVVGACVLVAVVARVGVVRPDFSILGRFVRYGVVLLPAGYAIWALNWADRLFLVHYKTLSAVGLYSLAYSLGYLFIQAVVNPIWTMFPNAMAELWNTGRRAEAQRLFETTAGAMIVLTFPVIAGAAVLAPGFIRILAPSSFVSAAPVMPIVLAGYLCFMLAAFYETVFGLVDKQVLGVLTVGVACAVNVALNFVLIPLFSYIGAAVATLVAFIVQLVCCLYLARRLQVLRTPLRMPLRIAVASVALALVLLPARGFFLSSGSLRWLAGVVTGVLVYAVLCRLLRIVEPGVISRELRRLARRPAAALDSP